MGQFASSSSTLSPDRRRTDELTATMAYAAAGGGGSGGYTPAFRQSKSRSRRTRSWSSSPPPQPRSHHSNSCKIPASSSASCRACSLAVTGAGSGNGADPESISRSGSNYSRSRSRSVPRCRRRGRSFSLSAISNGWIGDLAVRLYDRILGRRRTFQRRSCHRQTSDGTSFSRCPAEPGSPASAGLLNRAAQSGGYCSNCMYQRPYVTETGGVRTDVAAVESRQSSSLTLGGFSAGRQCDACRKRVRINVSGQQFEIRAGLLRRHPLTLLGDDARRRRFYDRRRDELFLDRHRPTFEAVFAYYMYGGRLRRPSHVPDDVFLAELEFYELEPCAIDDYRRSEGYTEDEELLPKNRTLRWLWMLFEHPETSLLAYVVAVISVIITLVSIVLFCVETLPFFAQSHCVDGEAPNFLDPFFVIETVCTLWFTVEVSVRFIASPSKLLFWRDFKNIVDLTAVVPYYVTFFNVVSTMNCATAKSSASLAFLRVIRLVRVFKLTKHSVGLQVLIMTVKASREELGLFLVILLVCMLVYSSAIYYAELDVEGKQIHSIPDAFWWAIITMTTVGYGDKVPKGYAGKMIGAACAITGVLTLAMPVPIITGHFNRFYLHKTRRARHA